MNKEDYFKYYIQGSDHYLIPKDVFNELFDEMSNWREENQELKQKYLNAVADYETTMAENKELKKQLDTSNELVAQSVQTEMKLRDENNRLRKEYQDTYKDVCIEIKEYKSQQKEFIKYLEDEKDRLAREHSNICKDKFDEVDDILQKYRSIIGCDKVE